MSDVVIYQPAKNAMQSGRANAHQWRLEFETSQAKTFDPLMGWTGARETDGQVRLIFGSREEAVAFAEKHKLTYQVRKPNVRHVWPRNYSDNFSYTRIF
jgi:hypothetical protein